MRVDGKWRSRGFVHDHIRGFAPDARQAHQRGAVLRYSAVKLVAQHNRQGINIFCFVAIKPDGFDVIANARFAQRSHFFRAVGLAEQCLGCLLTPLSVACADKTTATRSVKLLVKASSVCGVGSAAERRSKNRGISAFFMRGTLASLPRQRKLVAGRWPCSLCPMRYNYLMSDVIALPQDFQLVLRPNALSRDGFIILMMVFAAICLVAGGFFLAIGAWPVFGFFGLDILILYLAFRINYRRARRYEMLEMRDGRLVLSKVTATGKVRDWVFDPYWVRVRLEKVASILRFSDLFLSSHGQKLLWAGFLPLPSVALWQPRWSTHCRVSGPVASDFTCQNSHSFRLFWHVARKVPAWDKQKNV